MRHLMSAASLFLLLTALGAGCCGRPMAQIEARWHLAPDEAVVADVTAPMQSPCLRGGARADNFVVDTPEQWRRIWRSVDRPPPCVDFKAHVVVGAVRIISDDSLLAFWIKAVELREGGAVVYVEKEIPRPGEPGHATVRGREADYVMIRRPGTPFIFVELPYWSGEGSYK